jgi:exonuclease VII small subunit
MTQPTESMNKLFKRLEEIKQKLSNSTPDLDNIMPLYEEANQIEEKLSDFFEKTQKTIEEKQAKRNQQ